VGRHMRELFESRSRWFDIGVCLAGLFTFVDAGWGIFRDSTPASPYALLAVPLIVVVAKFPMVLDSGDGTIEVGFDSSILMFLLCTLDADSAVVLWSLGVMITQFSASKRFPVKLFNVGVGISGSGVAAVVLFLVRDEQRGTPLELLAVACAAGAYFLVDFMVSAISVAIESATTLRGQLMQRGTLVAIFCFVSFDSLGYLGAVVYRAAPLWTLFLLAVPLATLLVATRAVNRGSEHARRLGVLFDAAVRAQTLSDSTQVVSALTEDARRLLRIARVEVRPEPPGPHEVGAQIHDGQTDSWIVAPGRHRARSTTTADKQALDAMAAVSSDAFSRLRLTEDMVHLARYDLLTDLPNRGLLLDRVRHGLQTARRRESAIALLFVDLDGFKPVNDRFGHAAGDSVLIDVARRLSECVREGDTVARLGGDEFALLFEDVNPHDVASACERILATLSQGVVVAGHDLQLGASIGVAYGDGLDTAEGMLRNADLAMYEAKARGKSRYVVYEPAIGRSRLQRLELVESLRAAVAADQIQVVYQPIVETVTGLISGVEALARWRSNGVDVPPDVFIRVAEESGLIIPLGDAVLSRAARDAAVLQQAAGRPITISVNISAKQLCEPDFVEKVERAIETMGEGVLVLEITERDGIGTDPETVSAMQTLSERGVPLAIDDFGVGFSSISYLQDMPIQIIKADASLSANIDRDERACALLKSITMMGDALGLVVVVEGIERAEQLERLRDEVGAPYAQGYLMYRPMALPVLLDAVRENRDPDAVDVQDLPAMSRVSTVA
jgi:diguanylate cyclase (GGDEF)-like protein